MPNPRNSGYEIVRGIGRWDLVALMVNITIGSGILGLPSTYFIDRDGIIQSVFTGPLEDEGEGTNVQGAIGETELDQHIQEILGGG